MPVDNSHITLYTHRNPYATPGTNTTMIGSACMGACTCTCTHTHMINMKSKSDDLHTKHERVILFYLQSLNQDPILPYLKSGGHQSCLEPGEKSTFNLAYYQVLQDVLNEERVLCRR